MKKALAVWAVVLTLGLTALSDAEAARRLGGGKSSGMQRDSVTQPVRPGGANGNAATNPQQAPANAAAPAAATAPAAAAAAQQRRSWTGPLAGLAAGLGLAALASYLGFGEELATMLLLGLLAMVVLAVIGMVMRRRAGGQTPAMAGTGRFGGTAGGSTGGGNAPLGQNTGMQRSAGSFGGSLIGSRIGGGGIGSALGGTAAPVAAARIPADFDVDGFVRNAKANFLALQSANDARDLRRLADYLTPEMLEAVRADIETRDATPQATEVFGLQAQVLEVAEEPAQYVVS